MQFIMVCHIPGNDNQCGALVVVPGRNAGGGRFILWSNILPKLLSLKMPPSLSCPYPPTSTIVKRYLALHIAMMTKE